MDVIIGEGGDNEGDDYEEEPTKPIVRPVTFKSAASWQDCGMALKHMGAMTIVAAYKVAEPVPVKLCKPCKVAYEKAESWSCTSLAAGSVQELLPGSWYCSHCLAWQPTGAKSHRCTCDDLSHADRFFCTVQPPPGAAPCRGIPDQLLAGLLPLLAARKFVRPHSAAEVLVPMLSTAYCLFFLISRSIDHEFCAVARVFSPLVLVTGGGSSFVTADVVLVDC